MTPLLAAIHEPRLLPPPDAEALRKAAVSAAEALHLLGTTLAREPETIDDIWTHVDDVARRIEEARIALQILGSAHEDAGRSPARAYEIAGRIGLDDAVTLDDLDDFEAWCRDEARAPEVDDGR